MHLKSIVAGAALALSLSASVQAQDLIDGSNVEEILNLARGYGSASLGAQDNGDPSISGRIEGVLYTITFMNCTDNRDCESINFYSGFAENKQSMEAINAWNRDTRFAKAYLDSDLDAVIEWDVNLQTGVSRENLDAQLLLWSRMLSDYARYIGYK